jgi:hypothetical protein
MLPGTAIKNNKCDPAADQRKTLDVIHCLYQKIIEYYEYILLE